MMITLKPCPFCGEKISEDLQPFNENEGLGGCFTPRYVIACISCNFQLSAREGIQVITKWNQRVDQPPHDTTRPKLVILAHSYKQARQYCELRGIDIFQVAIPICREDILSLEFSPEQIVYLVGYSAILPTNLLNEINHRVWRYQYEPLSLKSNIVNSNMKDA